MYRVVAFAIGVLLAACGQANGGPAEIETSAGKVSVEVVASGLDHPWGMAFLPGGGLLVTERAGRLRILGSDGKLSAPIEGVPEVHARGQGGLLDVALDPDFAASRLIYLSYAEPGEGGASTALARARLPDANRLENLRVIFRQQPKVSGNGHFGGRVVFPRDGKLFLTTGDRQKFDPAQDLTGHIGKVLRLERDGRIPADNPFVGRAGVRPEIWSYGHRNIQGAAIDPRTGRLWTIEFGPAGGDELNRPEAGRNYGWPLVSWGSHYDGRDIPDPPTRPVLADAVKYWNPAISPSGMIFYTGSMFTSWNGDLLIAGLGSERLVRLRIENDKVTAEEQLDLDERIRDVEQAPDGSLYLATDGSGEIWRLRLK